MLSKGAIEVIASVLPYDKKDSQLLATIIAEELWKSGLVSNSARALDEQEPNIYSWTAIESDGYAHSESGVAMNMLDAFIKATEHNPSYHKYVEIRKLDKEEYTAHHNELLEWYTQRFKSND